MYLIKNLALKERKSCRNKSSLLEQVNQNILKWSGHMNTMNERSLFKRKYRVKLDETTKKDKLEGRWIEELKKKMSIIGSCVFRKVKCELRIRACGKGLCIREIA